MSNLATGNLGEDIAVKYLKKKQYKIIERNYRTNLGEIDIVCQKDNIIFFVEVKTMRLGSDYGDPFEKVNYYKAKKLMQNAQFYLIKKNYPEDRYWQIDVISVELNYEKRKAKVRHLKDVI